MKLVHAALLLVGITISSPASAEISPSQADARLIGMLIYTADGLLIGQVINVEIYGSRRTLVAAIGGLVAFGPRFVWIPLSWANKEEDCIVLLLTNAEVAALLGFGLGIGIR